MLIRAIFILAFTLAPIFSHADELTTAKKADIRQLMDMTGGSTIPKQFADAITQNMAEAFKQARPEIPERFYATLHKDLLAFFKEKANTPGSIMEKTVSVYHKHFTHPEIKELLAFYQTPIGKKTIREMPQIAGENMAEARLWGQSLGADIDARIKAAFKKEGIALPAQSPQASKPQPAK